MLYQDTTSGSLAWPDNPLDTLISPPFTPTPTPPHTVPGPEPEPALLLGTQPNPFSLHWLIPLC